MRLRNLDIDGFPIRNVNDLLRWDKESAARFAHYRDRFRALAGRFESPYHGGVTREDLQVAFGAYMKAHQERSRQYALFEKFMETVVPLAHEHETFGEMLDRIGPEEEDALVRAIFGDADSEA